MMLIKALQNAGFSLKEIREMDAYEMMINLGGLMYDNDGGEEGDNNGREL